MGKKLPSGPDFGLAVRFAFGAGVTSLSGDGRFADPDEFAGRGCAGSEANGATSDCCWDCCE